MRFADVGVQRNIGHNGLFRAIRRMAREGPPSACGSVVCAKVIGVGNSTLVQANLLRVLCENSGKAEPTKAGRAKLSDMDGSDGNFRDTNRIADA